MKNLFITLIVAALICACSSNDPKPDGITGKWTFQTENLSGEFTVFKSGNEYYVKKGSSFKIDGTSYLTANDERMDGSTDFQIYLRTDYQIRTPNMIRFVASDNFSRGSNVLYQMVDPKTNNIIKEGAYGDYFPLIRK